MAAVPNFDAFLRGMAADILQLREELAAAKATNADQQQRLWALEYTDHKSDHATSKFRDEADKKMITLHMRVTVLEEEKRTATERIAALERVVEELRGANAGPAAVPPQSTVSGEEANQRPKLNIVILYKNIPITVKVAMTMQFQKIFDVAADRFGKDKHEIRFLYEGARIRPDATPAMLDMQDGDRIHVFMEQYG